MMKFRNLGKGSAAMTRVDRFQSTDGVGGISIWQPKNIG